MLLSRVGNACFWMSRYRERAEFMARVLDVHLHTRLDTVHTEHDPWAEWEPMLLINGCTERFTTAPDTLNAESALHCLVLDANNSSSISSCIRSARENARHAREQISSEMWEQINDMYLMIGGTSPHALVRNAHSVMIEVKNGALLFQGLTDHTMMHGEAWHFIQAGRYIERANTGARLLSIYARRTETGEYREALHWLAVLKSASSLEAFHKTYTSPVSAELAIEFLLLNEESPRSILYCMESAAEALRYVSGSTARRFANEAERQLGQMAARLRYLKLQEVDLMALLADIQSCLYYATEAITQMYFSYEVA